MSDLIPISDLTSGFQRGTNGEENHQTIKVKRLIKYKQLNKIKYEF